MILNKTTKSRERYRVIPGSMGCAGDPKHYPTHKYEIAAGVDRGNGYQCYMSVTTFLEKGYIPEEAKQKLIAFLRGKGYQAYLNEVL